MDKNSSDKAPAILKSKKGAGKSLLRHIIFWSILLAVILIPFFIFGSRIEGWTRELMTDRAAARPVAALLMAALLASDIVLPVPSSLASTACGYFAGIINGTMLSFLGMMISSIAGYWLGRKPGTFAFNRSLGEKELHRLENLNRKYGSWLLVIARPVPVLAEASVFFSGLSGMRFRAFLAIVSLSNLGISAVYASVGSMASEMNTFLLAFGASMLLPLIFLLLSALLSRRR